MNAWELVRRYYSNLKMQQGLDHDYYNLKVKISTPSGYEAVLPPTARTLVNDAADHIASETPDFTVPRPGQTEKQERRAEKIQKWDRAWWSRVNENEPQPIHRKMTVHGLAKGMIAVHLSYIPERIGQEPGKKATDQQREAYEAKRRMAFPFGVEVVDPRYVYPDPGTDGETYVIEHFMKNVGTVQQQHPEWMGWKDKNGTPRDPNAPVEWIYYCDRHYRAYIADFQFVTFARGQREPGPVPHGLGFVPWVIRSAGVGDDSGTPDERFQSMLYIVRGMLDEEMRVWSQLQAIIRDSAWPWMVTPIGAKVDPGGRKISEVPPELVQHIKQLRPDAEAPKAITTYIELLGTKMEQATYSQVITGHAPGGQRSGYSIAVLAGMARVKFGPILRNVESALAELMRKAHLTVENRVQDKVRIWMGGSDEFEIGPSDLAGYERVNVEIKAKLVQDRAADADVGLKLYQTGALSAETMLKDFAHIPEPLEELDRRIAEDFIKYPPIQMQIMLDLAKKRGMPDDLIRLFIQGTGMKPGGGMQPGAPGGQQPPGVSTAGGTPANPTGMEGSATPGAPAPPGNPSIPGPGPTSPIGPGAGPPGTDVLRELGRLATGLKSAGQLGNGSDIPIG